MQSECMLQTLRRRGGTRMCAWLQNSWLSTLLPVLRSPCCLRDQFPDAKHGRAVLRALLCGNSTLKHDYDLALAACSAMFGAFMPQRASLGSPCLLRGSLHI